MMPTRKPPRALMVAFHRIGDLTASTPLLRALAGDRSLSVLSRPFGAALLGAQPYLERVWTLAYPNRGRRGLGRLLFGGHRRALGRRLAAAGLDEVLIYETERDVIREWLNDCLPGRVRELACRAPQGTHVSELGRMAAASAGCDMALYDPVPRLHVDDRARQRSRDRLQYLGGRIIGVQMGSQRTHAPRPLNPRPNLKSLDRSQWTALVSRLITEEHADTVLIHGASRERPMVRRLIAGLREAVRERCHDGTDLGLDLLPAVLQRHDALISVDTGTAHIAAAVGCPLLVLFGPTDPGVFAPRGIGAIEILLGAAPCQFCHGTPLYKRCRDNICLNRLDDDVVWGAWVRLRERIDGPGPGGSDGDHRVEA